MTRPNQNAWRKMSRVEKLWERLVRAALRKERTGGDAYEHPVGGIVGNVPAALSKNSDIDEILRVADGIQDEDPNISRILCEHAYSLSQNLDPNSEGRGVLQFKTGLLSVIKQKLAKREVGTIDRSQDIVRLQEFYKLYRDKNNADKLREEETKLRESGAFTREILGELERKTVQRKRVFATLKVLGTVLEQLTKEIPDELKQVMESDSALTEDLVAYNIIPLDAPSTNAIVLFPEVQAAVSALKYFSGLPELPTGYFISHTRNCDMLDFLQYTFGFQKDNVANQREHIVHMLANEQSRLGIPDETDPKLDEAAVQKTFLKPLENYIKWCNYLCIQPVWSSLEAVSKEKKLLYVSLYFLIWGEAANIRFLPECLCYIFHHMAREMDEILSQQTAQPAKSCTSENGTDISFLDQEAASNDNGKAPHSSWRNYDDFNEFFWSLHCFELSWPWRTSSSFFHKPQPRSKGLSIIAFNNGNLNAKTLRELLSLGPTFIVMKFVERTALRWTRNIKPLVNPTRDIIKETAIRYSWHDFVSKNNHNALTVASLWGPVFAIRSLKALRRLFEQFPTAFMDTLHIPLPSRSSQPSAIQAVDKNKFDAAQFSPVWNEIIRNLREEDYITNFELELLLMPRNSGDLPLVQWPLFLLASKIFLAKDIAAESRDTQDELWDRISKDEYMKYAVQECYYAIKHILTEILDEVGRMVERIYDDINACVTQKTIHLDFQLNKLPIVISRVIALMGILKEAETPELERVAVSAVQDLYDVVRYDVFSVNMRENYDTWNLLTKARDEGHLFSKLKWPKNTDLKAQVKRLHSLLTIKESASSIPKNLEARRRLEFFANSLFMKMPVTKPIREMLSFGVFTPYYSEIVLYSMAELLKKNEDGISILFYLQKIYPDEWKNFLARIGRDENALDTDLYDSPSDILELRFWASYRGQTLARTAPQSGYHLNRMDQAQARSLQEIVEMDMKKACDDWKNNDQNKSPHGNLEENGLDTVAETH
ncbi:hypothetical protein Lal_00047450 [Lupinus albus]|nr:hypothetical protein Lal_00047450 [Lupinus albus]